MTRDARRVQARKDRYPLVGSRVGEGTCPSLASRWTLRCLERVDARSFGWWRSGDGGFSGALFVTHPPGGIVTQGAG